jgi:hypothetical protein
MQTPNKISYYDIEAFHHNGKLIIQFMPEYLHEIQDKLNKSNFSATTETSVECFKYTPSASGYLRLTMQQIELDYSDGALEWFISQYWGKTS